MRCPPKRVEAIVVAWLFVLLFPKVLVWGQSVEKETDRREIGRTPNKAGVGALRAVVIGIDQYTHPKFPPQRTAQRDARDVAALLTDLGWSVLRISASDENRRPVSRDEMMRQVREVYESTKDGDTLLVYFAGHAMGEIVDDKRHDYLCVGGTDPDRLGETAISVGSLARLLESARPAPEKTHAAKTVLMVDACLVGTERLPTRIGVEPFNVVSGHVLSLALEPKATTKGERGLVDAQGQTIENGLLTHLVLKGLRGGADENADTHVTFRELNSWVGKQRSLLANNHPDVMQASLFTWHLGVDHDITLASATEGRELQGLTWLRKNAQGCHEYALNKDPSVVMILIPGGTFTMGSTDADAASPEKPLTLVTLGPYLIAKHELTWGQYKKFAQDSGHPMPQQPSFTIDDAHPVVHVDWSDAVAYGKWAGVWQSDAHPGLPTEAEWEYAARGPEGRKWPWGSTSPDSDQTLANHGPGSDLGKADGYQFTAPVGSFPPGVGPFGTLDQAGNVSEWCADGYGPYPGGSVTNPMGATSRFHRVFRGGSWYNEVRFLRGSYRLWDRPSHRDRGLGFRPAVQVTS